LTVNPNSIPVHLGLILDGNRRWAIENGMPTLEGHRKGYENLKTIGTEAIRQGIQYVSAYVFSTENWNRSKHEVDYLMKLLLHIAKTEVKELHKQNIRVRFLGLSEKLSQEILASIHKAEELTKDNTAGSLALCLNYGGQQEIVSAVNNVLKSSPGIHEISTADIEKNLYAPDIPPVDFMIRTSGELRISNFMLWRLAYSELYFVDTYWPAFTVTDLTRALEEFSRRKRRFGN
jgi:undecaprenyl diphosphate synthase